MARIATVNADQTVISTDKTVMDADGVEVCTISVNVTQMRETGGADSQPMPIQNLAAAQVVVAVSGTGNTVTQPTGFTDAAGNIAASFVTTVAENKTISATVRGVASTSGNPVVIAGGTPPTPPPEGDPDYETGFEAATFAELNANGFVWGGSTRATISTERAFAGTRSVRMAYQAAAAGSDSRTQQNFNLGQNVTEVWFEWQMYLNANYTTRAGESPSNNKWFRLWGDDYNAGNKVGASTDYSAIFDDNTRLRFEYTFRTYADGLIGFGPSGSQSPATSFGGAMKSAWTRVRLHLKMVTTAQNDGVMELWFGSTKVIDFQNVNAKYDTIRPYWNQGYILGAANSGFTSETLVFVDDFKFYTTDPEWT